MTTTREERLARRRAIRRGEVTPRRWVRKGPVRPSRDPAKLFWPKVRKTAGCWLWSGVLDKDGYGKFQVTIQGENRQRTVKANRFAFELAHGRPPTGNLLHECDTPACVRLGPGHNREGTQSENIRQCVERGRHPAHTKRFTVEQVRDIRARHRRGLRTIDIAEHYEAPHSTVTGIVLRRTWKWVA